MQNMATERAPEASQFRVTLFVGPQPVEGKPFTSSCVFNVKKRSWKGGIQVAVVLTQSQIDTLSADVDFSGWLAVALVDLVDEDLLGYQKRAHEPLIQALCWCKLDLTLQSGIVQENQCLGEEIWNTAIREDAIKRRNFITSYVASELDLVLRDVTAP